MIINNGKDFKKWRIRKGWSQKELAEKLGYNQRFSISHIENGCKKMTKQLQILCEYIDKDK
tara:strand:- start:141 stop:323 length:183 start_codon:yes stop_codon:yes gene_type:complete